MADKGLLLFVIGCATASICICEAVSWLLVFRLEDFQRLHAQYASASKRLARKQEELATVAVDKKIDKKDKKLIMLEREFSRASRDLGTYKWRCNMLAGVFHTFTLFTLKASYDSVVLARLPFMPFSFITGITHRNLPGDDMRDAGILFIYALCSLAIKPNLQKLLGHEMPSEMQHAARRAEKLMESFGMKVDMPK